MDKLFIVTHILLCFLYDHCLTKQPQNQKSKNTTGKLLHLGLMTFSLNNGDLLRACYACNHQTSLVSNWSKDEKLPLRGSCECAPSTCLTEVLLSAINLPSGNHDLTEQGLCKSTCTETPSRDVQWF